MSKRSAAQRFIMFPLLAITVLLLAGCGSGRLEGHSQLDPAPTDSRSVNQVDGARKDSAGSGRPESAQAASSGVKSVGGSVRPLDQSRPEDGKSGQPDQGDEGRSEDSQPNSHPQQTTDPRPTTDGGSEPVTGDPISEDDLADGSAAAPALVDAMASSVRNGGPGLAGLVGASGQSRCIADHAVSDIGAERYRSVYGVTAVSLQSGTSLLGVAYDRIDAEAVGAAMAACTNLNAVFGRLLIADGMEPEVSTCVIGKEAGLFRRMLVAELNHDRGLVEIIVNKLEDLAEHCTYPLDPGLVPDLTLEPRPEPEPEPEPAQDQTPPEPEPEPEPAQDQTPPEPEPEQEPVEDQTPPEPEPEPESAQDEMPPAQTDSE